MAHAGGSTVVYPGHTQDRSAPSRAGAAVRDGPEHSPAVASRHVLSPAGATAGAGGGSHPVGDRGGHAPRGDRDGRERAGRAGAGPAASGRSAHPGSGTGPSLPPCGPEGTARRSGRPHDPTAPTRGDRGKKTGHTVNHVRRINAGLTMLVRSATSAGSPHDQRMAEATPS